MEGGRHSFPLAGPEPGRPWGRAPMGSVLATGPNLGPASQRGALPSGGLVQGTLPDDVEDRFGDRRVLGLDARHQALGRGGNELSSSTQRLAEAREVTRNLHEAFCSESSRFAETGAMGSPAQEIADARSSPSPAQTSFLRRPRRSRMDGARREASPGRQKHGDGRTTPVPTAPQVTSISRNRPGGLHHLPGALPPRPPCWP